MLFKKQPQIGREAMFKSKPVRNDQLEWEKNEDGEVLVTLTRGASWKVRTLSWEHRILSGQRGMTLCSAWR